jgi:hypothetical protein
MAEGQIAHESYQASCLSHLPTVAKLSLSNTAVGILICLGEESLIDSVLIHTSVLKD